MSEATSEILMFQVGARVFATHVGAVIRIGPAGAAAEDVVERSALGEPFERRRGIVVAPEAGAAERTLVVDHVLGVRTVAASELHALPAFAAECMPSAAVTGFVLVDESPMLLVDVPSLVRGQRLAAPAAP